MKNKRVALLAAITALILLAIFATETRGLFAGEPQKAPKEHPLHIKKMNKEWGVVHSDGTRKPVTASRGENIVWTAFGSDVFLQFPDSTLFGTYTATITAGKKLTLTVMPAAKAGRYLYSAFCLTDKKFARGDSPPIIIIE
jgi:hypothetical protein